MIHAASLADLNLSVCGHRNVALVTRELFGQKQRWKPEGERCENCLRACPDLGPRSSLAKACTTEILCLLEGDLTAARARHICAVAAKMAALLETVERGEMVSGEELARSLP